MAGINMSSIMKKVKDYSESEEGRKRMKQYIEDCRRDGRAQTATGDIIITEDIMIRAAEALIRVLQETATAKGLPDSIIKHFHSLYYNQPVLYGKENNQYKVDIQFGDDLSRMSLKITSGSRKGEHTGEGIDNIVSLFNTGYDAEKQVYGEWEGHIDPYTRENTIASLTHRDGLHFMEEAINSFNREYGELYHVFAYISSEDPRFYT